MTDHVKDQLCARIEELEKEKLELNEQLDELQKERDALAAHLERIQSVERDETEYGRNVMDILDYTPTISLARLKAEWDKAELQPVWETLIKVAVLLGIDVEGARSLPGKPSDVYAAYLARHDAELLNRPFSGLPGCSDGGCVVRRPKGMHTNGGCQCIRYQTASIIVQRLAYLRDELRRQAEGGEA